MAGAAARRNELAGKSVGVVISGGNITAEQLKRILGHELEYDYGRSVT
jgi:threonine dehydratase